MQNNLATGPELPCLRTLLLYLYLTSKAHCKLFFLQIQEQSTKQTGKQNITKDIDIKNKLTVTREERGGDNGGERVKGLHKQL